MKKYTLKKASLGLLALMLAIGISSCHVHHGHHKKGKIPPGHAKKITGEKNAKRYAPGQRKK